MFSGEFDCSQQEQVDLIHGRLGLPLTDSALRAFLLLYPSLWGSSFFTPFVPHCSFFFFFFFFPLLQVDAKFLGALGQAGGLQKFLSVFHGLPSLQRGLGLEAPYPPLLALVGLAVHGPHDDEVLALALDLGAALDGFAGGGVDAGEALGGVKGDDSGLLAVPGLGDEGGAVEREAGQPPGAVGLDNLPDHPLAAGGLGGAALDGAGEHVVEGVVADLAEGGKVAGCEGFVEAAVEGAGGRDDLAGLGLEGGAEGALGHGLEAVAPGDEAGFPGAAGGRPEIPEELAWLAGIFG